MVGLGLLNRQGKTGMLFQIDDTKRGNFQAFFGASMGPIPEIGPAWGMLAGFGNKTGVEGDQPGPTRPDRPIDQGAIQADKVKRLTKLTRIGPRRQPAVATQIAEGDFAPEGEDRRKQRQKKFPLGFGDGQFIEYLFCQVHVPFASGVGFFDLVVEDTNLSKRHFFVKICPQY